MRPSTWRGIAALVLAAGVTAGVIIIAIETILHVGPVSQNEATLLATVLGAAVGAVATFLGGVAQHDGPSSSSSGPVSKTIENLEPPDPPPAPQDGPGV